MMIIISHIQDDLRVAVVLKKWVEETFGKNCQVVASTDPESIPLVPRYLDRDDDSLRDLKALIPLCSPESLQRPWIAFEAGCAWMKKILILPVCHSGLSPAELPPPLAVFSPLDLGDKSFPETFFSTLEKEMGISPLPEIAYGRMRLEISQLLQSMPPQPPSAAPGANREGATGKPLQPIHVDILQTLAGSYGYTAAVMADHFKMEEKKMIPLLKRLVDENLVYPSSAGMGNVRYNLTTAGKAYLKGNRS
jgi:hypothetical protein